MKKAILASIVLLLLAALIVAVTRYFGTGPGHRQASFPPDTHQAKPALQPTTLKLLFPLNKPEAQDEVMKAVEAKLVQDGLPFKLEFTFIPYDQYWSKVWLASASGEPYDLALTAFSNIADFVAKKTLAPLDDALKNYGQDIVKSTPDYAFQAVTIKGNIYGIPRVMPIAEFQGFVQIRGDLRKKHGLPDIRDAAEMDDYLAAIANNEPAVVPYFYDTGRFLLREYGGDVAFLAGGYFNSPVYIDPADPQLKVRNTYESGFFRSIMDKLHDWQRKGYAPYSPSGTPELPDPERALYDGKVGATWSVVLKQTERIDEFKAAMPGGELENVYLHPEKPKYMFAGADNILSVLSTSRHVNEAVAFLNWVRSSQTNYDLFTYGIKDLNYKLENGGLSYDGIAPEHRYMPISWAWNDIRYARFSKYISPQYVQTLRSWDRDAVASPTLGFTPDLAPIKSEIAQLNAVISEYLPLLYDEKVDWDATMDKFRAKLKDAGIDHVIAEIQKQFDAFAKK